MKCVIGEYRDEDLPAGGVAQIFFLSAECDKVPSKYIPTLQIGPTEEYPLSDGVLARVYYSKDNLR